MGADRRGPLAAFIVIAVIAGVLLVTSVRSQAAPPDWLDPDKLPVTVVAGSAVEPHLWDSTTGGVDQVVQEGAVLVRRAAVDSHDDARTTEALAAPTSLATAPPTGSPSHPARHRVAGSGTHHAATQTHHPVTTRPHHAATRALHQGPAHHDVPRPSDDAPSPPSPPSAPSAPSAPSPPSSPSHRSHPSLWSPPSTPGLGAQSVGENHDHGRHLGWYQGHGHGKSR